MDNELADVWTRIIDDVDRYQVQLVVAPTAGVKSDILSAYAERKRLSNTACWSVPTTRTWDEHLRHVWKRSKHEFKDYRLLAPQEFRYHWLKTGLETFQPQDKQNTDYDWNTKYVTKICDDTLRAWQLLNDYDLLDTDDLWGAKQHDDSLQAHFREWVRTYRKLACKRKWLSEAELAGFLTRGLCLKHFYFRNGTHTLFVTLQGQETIRCKSDYIGKYKQAACEAGQEARYIGKYKQAACEAGQEARIISLARPTKSFQLPGSEFVDTNRELQAAATQAREWLTQDHGKLQSGAQPRTVRIGIVVANLARTRTQIQRQFLATFCPNGHWAWQIPRFTIQAQSSLSEVPICRELLSYLRVRHAKSIVHRKARALVRSGKYSGVIPKKDFDKLKKWTKHDQEIDTEIQNDEGSASLSSPKDRDKQTLASWMRTFEKLLKKCRHSLKTRRRAEFRQVFSQYLGSGDRKFDPDQLIEQFSIRDGPFVIGMAERECLQAENLSTKDRKDRLECLETLSDCPAEHQVLERLLELGQKETSCGGRLSTVEEVRLSRLDGLIERFQHDSVARRVQEICRDLAAFAAADGRKIRFDDAYEHLSAACAAERPPSDLANPAIGTVPVEILSVEQAAGRRFTHLWIARMRDTEWPPIVRPLPLVDARVLREAVPTRFHPEKAAQNAEKEFEMLVDGCDNRENIRLSYAVRDAGAERAFTGAHLSAEDEEDGEHGAGFDAASPEYSGSSLTGGNAITWQKEVEQTEIRFHPLFYFPDGSQATTLSTGLDANVVVKQETKWANAEYATQFECPFRAFAIHRLEVERPERKFGARHLEERSRQVEEFLKFIGSLHGSGGKVSVKEEWKEWIRLRHLLNPTIVGDGMYMYTFNMYIDKKGNEKYVVDCKFGGAWQFFLERIDVQRGPRKPNAFPTISGITKNSFTDFTKRRKLYPLRVLHWAVEQEDDFIPAYAATESLDIIKSIKFTQDPGFCWKKEVKKLLEEMEKGYNKGIIVPDPVGGKDPVPAAPGETPEPRKKEIQQVAKICKYKYCHLQAACRYNYVDEPTEDRSREQDLKARRETGS